MAVASAARLSLLIASALLLAEAGGIGSLLFWARMLSVRSFTVKLGDRVCSSWRKLSHLVRSWWIEKYVDMRVFASAPKDSHIPETDESTHIRC